jgi:hypothetical protein
MGQPHIVRSQKDLPACTTSTALAARQIYNYSLDSRHIDKKNIKCLLPYSSYTFYKTRMMNLERLLHPSAGKCGNPGSVNLSTNVALRIDLANIG